VPLRRPRAWRARQCRAPTAGALPGSNACRWHVYEETRDSGVPGRVGFGTLFAPQSIARREGKERLGWLPTPTGRSEAPHTNALRPFGKAFFSFSPASGTHGAQKRAKAHIPGLLQDHAWVSFLVLRRSSLWSLVPKPQVREHERGGDSSYGRTRTIADSDYPGGNPARHATSRCRTTLPYCERLLAMGGEGRRPRSPRGRRILCSPLCVLCVSVVKTPPTRGETPRLHPSRRACERAQYLRMSSPSSSIVRSRQASASGARARSTALRASVRTRPARSRGRKRRRRRS